MEQQMMKDKHMQSASQYMNVNQKKTETMKMNLIKIHDKGEIALFTPTLYISKCSESFEIGLAFLNWSIFVSFEKRKDQSDTNTHEHG